MKRGVIFLLFLSHCFAWNIVTAGEPVLGDALMEVPAGVVSRPARQARAVTEGLTVNSQSREDVRNFYNTLFQASEGIAPDWTGSVDTCTAGTVSSAYQEATRLRINYFRAMAGVPAAVTFDSVFNAKAQQAALMMLANNTLSHDPPATWNCYSADGAEAAGKSNLSLGHAGPDAVFGQMQDEGSNNAAVGHRYWILYPQTQVMGSGSVKRSDSWQGANSLWVFDSNYSAPRPNTRDEFVSWPAPGYVPYQLAFRRWSFFFPNADFSNTSVTMSKQGVAVDVAVEYTRSGRIVWIPNIDTASPPATDTTYTVTLQNVNISGSSRNFNYAVTLIDPKVYGADTVIPRLSGPSQPLVNQSNTYDFNTVPGVNTYQWRSTPLTDFSAMDGAEAGLVNFDAVISNGYDAVATDIKAAGSASFHLAHASWPDQILTFKHRFYAESNARLEFAGRLGLATANQHATVQVSLDDGKNWQTVYDQAGSNSSGEQSFTTRSVSLTSLAGKSFLLRLAYVYAVGGSYYPQTSAGSGWYIDNIQFTGVKKMGAVTQTNTGTAAFDFIPPQAGDYLLQVRGLLYAVYPLEWGDAKPVTALSDSIPVSYPLNLTVTGTGSVSGSPAGINCGIDCSENYVQGTVVTLTAAPGNNAVFSGWGGACSGTQTTCNVTMSAAKQVEAIFAANVPNDGAQAQLTNLAARAHVLSNKPMYGGFVVSDAVTDVILIGNGPVLTELGVSNVLSDPVMDVYDANGSLIYTNDDWEDDSVSAAKLISAGRAPSYAREPALYLTLNPGYYTFVLRGYGASEGEAVINIYRKPSGRLTNLAARSYISATNPMYGGLVVSGAATRVILAGSGPSLAGLGISNVLSDPLMEVYDATGNLIKTNNNWGDDAISAGQLSRLGIAPSYPAEPALYLTLDPGYYTFVVRGNQGSEGEAVINIYQQ